MSETNEVDAVVMPMIEFVKQAMPQVVSICKDHPSHADSYADAQLCHYASAAMKEKLRGKRGAGRGRWWDKETITLDQLRALLIEHVEKGDMVDVMNLAAMVYAREALEA